MAQRSAGAAKEIKGMILQLSAEEPNGVKLVLNAQKTVL
ncbi:methyl-accepting chemotaxis protein [Ensifer mexicanus]|nr:methyl-accepting chemotaxis protein [Sinorhizobium mexicanum]